MAEKDWHAEDPTNCWTVPLKDPLILYFTECFHVAFHVALIICVNIHHIDGLYFLGGFHSKLACSGNGWWVVSRLPLLMSRCSGIFIKKDMGVWSELCSTGDFSDHFVFAIITRVAVCVQFFTGSIGWPPLHPVAGVWSHNWNPEYEKQDFLLCLHWTCFHQLLLVSIRPAFIAI